MGDLNQVITLGIGTPADIEHFILFGLNITVVYGTIPVNLYDRDILSGTLHNREILGAGLQERDILDGTIEERA